MLTYGLARTHAQVLVGAILWEVERQRAASGTDYSMSQPARDVETVFLAELKRGATDDGTSSAPAALPSSAAGADS